MSNEQTWLAAVSHDECTINFDPRLNIIIGPNNIGKSRTMRFLIRCLANVEVDATIGIVKGTWQYEAIGQFSAVLRNLNSPSWISPEIFDGVDRSRELLDSLQEAEDNQKQIQLIEAGGTCDRLKFLLDGIVVDMENYVNEFTKKSNQIKQYINDLKGREIALINKLEMLKRRRNNSVIKFGDRVDLVGNHKKSYSEQLDECRELFSDSESNLGENTAKINQALGLIECIKYGLSSLRDNVHEDIGDGSDVRVVYIPTLRGIRRLLKNTHSVCSFDENAGVREFVQEQWQGDRISGNELFRSFIANSYKNTFKAESVRYWPDDDDERNGKGRVITLFTGLEMFQDLESRLLGTQEKRQSVAEFEHWISEHFFFGKQVTLTPNRKKERVHVTIGEDEKPIHELGEGIQTLLMLTYAARMIGEGIYFIEEPELSLHAGMQRLLLEQLLSLPNRQYFFTTHSPHMIDMANDYKGSVYTIESPPTPPGETPPRTSTGRLKRIDQSNLDLGKLLGARYSSLLTVNAMLWVEGIGDRKILQRFLELKQKKLVEENGSEQKVYKESIHFGFFEYAGTLVEHYDFSDLKEGASGDIDDDKIKARRIATNILLITDDDGVGDLIDDAQTLDESVTADQGGDGIDVGDVQIVDDESVTTDQNGDSVLDFPKDHVDAPNGGGDVPSSSGSSMSETSPSNIDTNDDGLDDEDKEKVDPKVERFRRLCRQLGKGHFYKLKVREIENLIPLDVLADYIEDNHKRTKKSNPNLKNYIKSHHSGKSAETDYEDLFDEAIKRLRNPPKENDNDARIARERPIDIPGYSQRKVEGVSQIKADLDKEYVGTYVDAVMGALITQFGASSSTQVVDGGGNESEGPVSVTRYYGTIKNKRHFAEEAVKKIKSYDDLDPKAKELTDRVYAFIEKMNR